MSTATLHNQEGHTHHLRGFRNTWGGYGTPLFLVIDKWFRKHVASYCRLAIVVSLPSERNASAVLADLEIIAETLRVACATN